MTSVHVKAEHEAPRGWLFDVEVDRNGDLATHEVTLSWADYEHWSHGSIAPERIVRAVVEGLLAEKPDFDLPARFDASTARRWCPSLDAVVPEIA